MPLVFWHVVSIKSQKASNLELSYDKTFCEKFAHYLLSMSKCWLFPGLSGEQRFSRVPSWETQTRDKLLLNFKLAAENICSVCSLSC